VQALELSEAAGSLSEYARQARHETLILTERGKAVAAVVPLVNEDYFSRRLASNPEFIAIIERGRAQYRKKGGASFEEMRRKYRVTSMAKRKLRWLCQTRCQKCLRMAILATYRIEAAPADAAYGAGSSGSAFGQPVE